MPPETIFDGGFGETCEDQIGNLDTLVSEIYHDKAKGVGVYHCYDHPEVIPAQVFGYS